MKWTRFCPQIFKRCKASGSMLDIVDSSSMLCRLEMEGKSSRGDPPQEAGQYRDPPGAGAARGPEGGGAERGTQGGGAERGPPWGWGRTGSPCCRMTLKTGEIDEKL